MGFLEFLGFAGFLERNGTARSGNNQSNTQTNNQTSKKDNEENKNHTNIQSNNQTSTPSIKSFEQKRNKTKKPETRNLI